MRIKESRTYIVHRAFNRGLTTPRYESFWDGYDYRMDFNTEAELTETVIEHYGPNWEWSIEFHQVQITETRIN